MTRETIVHLPFEAMLDQACERLMEKKQFYSVTRLRQMESTLTAIVDELDFFIRGEHEA